MPTSAPIIARNCQIHKADVGKVIEPNFQFLRRITAWSSSEIQQLIVSNPTILVNPNAISRLEFWKNFLNGDMKKLLLAAKRNVGLFSHNIDMGGQVAQKVALLNEYGLFQTDVQMVLVQGKGFFCRSTNTMEVLLKKVEGLGLPRGSLVFMHCLISLSNIGMDNFRAKMEVYKRYGWSESEFLIAFQKAPGVAILSKENIREKMDFLVETAGCKQSYIASQPLLLLFSLEKRLKPRHHVMCILKSANLLGSKPSFPTVMRLSENIFIEQFILPNKEKVPELCDIYTAACARQVQL